VIRSVPCFSRFGYGAIDPRRKHDTLNTSTAPAGKWLDFDFAPPTMSDGRRMALKGP
jgi:hypothetical protein